MICNSQAKHQLLFHLCSPRRFQLGAGGIQYDQHCIQHPHVESYPFLLTFFSAAFPNKEYI